MLTYNYRTMFAAAMVFLSTAVIFAQSAAQNIPPKAADVKERLNISPRHGEWVTYTAENNDQVNAWIVYPERKDKAPVVIVIHEIFGLNDWARTVADQLAKEGYIAIAPDFLTGKAPGGKDSKGLSPDDARTLNSKLDQDEVVRRINGAAKYATSLPAADKKFATVGFCWGGGISFYYATQQPALSAAVLYYGVTPAKEKLSGVRAPILGLYGGSDNRVNATIPDAENTLKALNRSYEKEIYDGAGHAFLRQQDGMDGANMKASLAAWPRTLQFLKKAFAAKSAADTTGGGTTLTASINSDDDCCP